MPTDVNALTLAAVLTAAGAVGAATLITGIVSQLKRIPGWGAILDRGNEPAAVLALSALLVAAAYVSTLGTVSAEGIFGAVVAWYGIGELAMAIHDRASVQADPAIPATETAGQYEQEFARAEHVPGEYVEGPITDANGDELERGAPDAIPEIPPDEPRDGAIGAH